jgi:hypothetical protein
MQQTVRLHTNEGYIPVALLAVNHRTTFRVSYQQVGSCQWLKNSARGFVYEHCAVEMPLTHVVHIDGIQDCARRGRPNLPNGASNGVAGIEGSYSQALAFPFTPDISRGIISG